jgi:ATP-dependent Zn protease
MAQAMEHCERPWWKRPPVWFIAIAAVALLIFVGVQIETASKAAPILYSVFLDQLDAGNVASVTFQGTEIHGRFKVSAGNAQRDMFRTRAPDFGDPGLIPELRKQRVPINVAAPSGWSWLLGRMPWPMLVFLAVALIAGVVRLVRGGKSGTPAATHPMRPIMERLLGLSSTERQVEKPPEYQSNKQKSR